MRSGCPGVEELVFSLSAKGLTTGEVQAHLAEVYGAEVSRQTTGNQLAAAAGASTSELMHRMGLRLAICERDRQITDRLSTIVTSSTPPTAAPSDAN